MSKDVRRVHHSCLGKKRHFVFIGGKEALLDRVALLVLPVAASREAVALPENSVKAVPGFKKGSVIEMQIVFHILKAFFRISLRENVGCSYEKERTRVEFCKIKLHNVISLTKVPPQL
jgi:hypothetical protein